MSDALPAKAAALDRLKTAIQTTAHDALGSICP